MKFTHRTRRGLDFEGIDEETPNIDSPIVFNVGGQVKKKIISGAIPGYDLRWFGVVGDGVADDTTAIQSAMDNIPPGATLILPPGVFLLTDTIVRHEPIAVIGTGSTGGHYANHSTTFLLAPTIRKTALEFGYRESSLSNAVYLRGFSVKGQAEEEEGQPKYSLIKTYNRMRHSHFEDLFLFRSTGNGLYCTRDSGESGHQNTYMYGVAAEHVGSDVLDYGIHYETGGYNLNISNCYAGFAPSYGGIRVSGGVNVNVNNCWVLRGLTGRRAIVIANTIHTVSITGNHINSGFIAISSNVQAGLTGGEISGNMFRPSESSDIPDYGIMLGGGVNGLNIHSNVIRDYNVAPIWASSNLNNHIHDNFDRKNNKKDTNRGVATIVDGQSSVVVNHNCKLGRNEPGYLNVQITPHGDDRLWVTNKGASTFTVNRSGTSGDISFEWAARSVMEMYATGAYPP